MDWGRYLWIPSVLNINWHRPNIKLLNSSLGNKSWRAGCFPTLLSYILSSFRQLFFNLNLHPVELCSLVSAKGEHLWWKGFKRWLSGKKVVKHLDSTTKCLPAASFLDRDGGGLRFFLDIRFYHLKSSPPPLLFCPDLELLMENFCWHCGDFAAYWKVAVLL